MYIHVHESMYKYKHVCTMFSSVRTNLPYPVQVVRIPDVLAAGPSVAFLKRCFLKKKSLKRCCL